MKIFGTIWGKIKNAWVNNQVLKSIGDKIADIFRGMKKS